MLSVSTVAFDLTVPDFYLPLAYGGRVVLATNEERHRPRATAELIRKRRITVMQAGPAYWRMLVDAGWQGAPDTLQIVCGGEAFPTSLVGPLLERARAVWNAYGPTEATVWATMHRVSAEDAQRAAVPLGTPLEQLRVYVLDEGLKPVPDGEVGELCIAGVGVARGYLHRPELTRERFVPSPFACGPTLYRTGDRGRRLTDGTFEYVGRTDHQVKLRGFRIELGEIEHHLQRLDGVREAVVALRDDGTAGAYLAAYVTLASGGLRSPLELREALRDHIPDYMLPTAVVVLEELPKTPNGKVDRNALPGVSKIATTHLFPEGAIEQALAAIWQRVLDLPGPCGVADDFFLIGGTSLQLHRVAEAVRTELGTELQIRALFRYSTVRSLAQHVRDLGTAEMEGHVCDHA